MDRNFIELLDTQVNAIKKSENDKNATEKILGTVILLLRNLKINDDVLKTYNEDDMLRVFSYYGNFAEFTCNFYQSSKAYLDPEILNDEKERELASKTQEVADVNAKIESIEKNDADLLKKEKELNKLNEKYENLTEKVSELKKIKETVSDDVLKNLECEEDELNKTIKDNQKIKHTLEREIKDLENTHQALSKSVAKANAKKKEIEESVISTIDEKETLIKEIYEKYSKDLNRTKEEIEYYKKQYSQLPDELIDAEKERDFYNLHLGENSSIVSKLEEYGIKSIENFLIETNRLKSSFEKELDRFDRLIKDVLIKQEEVREEINRRTGLSS